MEAFEEAASLWFMSRDKLGAKSVKRSLVGVSGADGADWTWLLWATAVLSRVLGGGMSGMEECLSTAKVRLHCPCDGEGCQKS